MVVMRMSNSGLAANSVSSEAGAKAPLGPVSPEPVLSAPGLPEAMLREAALRVTKQRVAVINAVAEHPHADTDSILTAVREQDPTVSHQAVYDVLKVLVSAGLVRKIQPRNSVARYEARVGDNHHHVVCRSCGVIADVDCATGFAPCLEASNTNGFQIEEAEVIYWGSCPECQMAAKAS